jgi:hypothetical protein
MTTKIETVLCPKCRQPAWGIDRAFFGKGELVGVEVWHLSDQVAWMNNGPQKTCVLKMSYKDSEELANLVASDIGGRK